MTDRELLARYTSGSAEAFTEIVERHTGKVYGTCLRVLGDRHAAEDAAQAVFLVLARKARSLAPATILSGWLFLTARQVTLRHRQKEMRRVRHEREAAAVRSEAGKSELWERVRPRLDEALARLPKRQRDAVVARYLDGRTPAEIGAELNCPPSTVGTRISRGLAGLRARLARGGVAVPAAALAGLLAEHAAVAAPSELASSIGAACLGTVPASQAALSLAEGTMKAMTMTKIKIAAAVLCAAMIVGGGGFVAVKGLSAGEPKATSKRLNPALVKMPANTWTVVHDGPPGTVPLFAKLEWMPELDKGMMWSSLNRSTRKATVKYYSSTGAWEEQATVFPPNLRTGYAEGVRANYVWLPGLKRMLMLNGGGGYNDHIETSLSALLDPVSGEWETLAGELRMCDKSADFNPSAGNDGGPTPLFGSLVYDAHNREAVSICGGCTWGRIGKEKEKLAVGDWFFDEAGEVKRVRRVLAAEKGKVTEGRKWYPANSGTWVFSEETKKWSPIEQPMGGQPPGRIMPSAVYDAGEKKIVMFGGDDMTRCMDDTWVYDCEKREWSRVKPKTSPPPRGAAAMVYVADQKCILLAGGFAPGRYWGSSKPLKDTWVYRTAENEWTKLAAELPVAGWLCSAAYDPGSKAVLYVPTVAPVYGKSKKTTVLGLRLDLGSARTAPAPAPLKDGLQYHCKTIRKRPVPLPDEWESEKNKGTDAAAGREDLSRLPANTWVERKPPMPAAARVWGSYAYDPRNHKGYAYGGGHSGYGGNDVNEYDLLRNRWKGMKDVVAYKQGWQMLAGGLQGTSFQGCKMMTIHARKSYAVDYVTNSVVTVHGDVFDIAENRFVSNIGRCPGRYGVGDQVCYEDTPDGIYAFHGAGGSAQLYLADVKAGKWNLVKKGGIEVGHDERATLCHDRKRNRLFYTVEPRGKERLFWSYDIATKEWTKIKPANKCPGLKGCPTYIDDLDAILWVWGTGSESKGDLAPKMTFYKIEENKFYTAPVKGSSFGTYGEKSNSPHYDPELKLVVRLTHWGLEQYIHVGVMRLDPKTLELTEAK